MGDDNIQYGPAPLRPGMRWETWAEREARYAAEGDPALAAWDCPCGQHNEPMTMLCHGCGYDSAS